MSDGVANVDATNPFAILESARDDNPENPIRLITIGVGINNYNDVLLGTTRTTRQRLVSIPEHARRRPVCSSTAKTGLLCQSHSPTKPERRWSGTTISCSSWRMIGYENRVTSDESFTRAEKKFAELPAGSATTVFFELELVDPYVLGNANKPLGECRGPVGYPQHG